MSIGHAITSIGATMLMISLIFVYSTYRAYSMSIRIITASQFFDPSFRSEIFEMTSGVRLIAGGPGNIECGQLTLRESKLSNQREHDINNVNARAVQQCDQQNLIPRTVNTMLIHQKNQLIDAPHDHVHQDYAEVDQDVTKVSIRYLWELYSTLESVQVEWICDPGILQKYIFHLTAPRKIKIICVGMCIADYFCCSYLVWFWNHKCFLYL